MFNISKPTVSQAGITVDVELDGHNGIRHWCLNVTDSQKAYETILQSPDLEPCEIYLKTYTGEKLALLGQQTVNVKYGTQELQLPLLVVEGNGPAQCGRNWLQQILLDCGSIKKLMTPVEQILKEYAGVFSNDLGTV